MLDFRDMYRLRLNKTIEVVATSVGLRHSNVIVISFIIILIIN